jgi:hypothetical protein
MPRLRPERRRLLACIFITAALGASACSGSASSSSDSSTTTRSTQPTTSTTSGPSATTPLAAPTTSAIQDGQYLTEVTEADPALAAYEQKQGNVALRALLTDGSAFCALLPSSKGVDSALVAIAVGARSDESQTRLPLTVTTFNSVEAVALLTLCPSELKLLPTSDRTRIHDLGSALAGRPT